MIGNILDNTTELWMTKYIIGEIFSSGGATLYKNSSDQTVKVVQFHGIFLTKNCSNNLPVWIEYIIFQFVLPWIHGNFSQLW